MGSGWINFGRRYSYESACRRIDSSRIIWLDDLQKSMINLSKRPKSGTKNQDVICRNVSLPPKNPFENPRPPSDSERRLESPWFGWRLSLLDFDQRWSVRFLA